MVNKKIEINFKEYNNLSALGDQDAELIKIADTNLANSYSPYSQFKVSSLILLEGNINVLGTNQENSAYPSGLCAERVAVFSAKSTYPNKKIEKVVIVTEQGNEFPFSPCGSCRQALMEYELNQKEPIEVILKSGNSKIWVFKSIKDLLPFAFEAEDILKKE
ncbi:cytidine deaminase [Vicingus serpentipes]|uniref:Cytidine deaminase n=1 Tax=Vicingus serpentipes TaxID=1926625 RepID=A0A5C6RYL6_9FLAO|nr:cytidine deaminase [Vicingus serpentipes]TXB66740.1 cytidine deaminase [Vicingus serpentipes]